MCNSGIKSAIQEVNGFALYFGDIIKNHIKNDTTKDYEGRNLHGKVSGGTNGKTDSGTGITECVRAGRQPGCG